jgi:hypothetical protein
VRSSGRALLLLLLALGLCLAAPAGAQQQAGTTAHLASALQQLDHAALPARADAPHRLAPQPSPDLPAGLPLLPPSRTRPASSAAASPAPALGVAGRPVRGPPAT